MIKIKDIIWEESKSSLYVNFMRYEASIRGVNFLSIVQDSDDNGLSRYYIHTCLAIFKVPGNQGKEEWGWFDSIEECKKKAEEIIYNEILSFIDMRDYKLDTILK